MRKLMCMMLVLLAGPAWAADHYEFDKEHTTILFFVNHLGFSDMVGLMTAYYGGFTFDAGNPQNSTIDVTLKPTGIRTSSASLDKQLWGENFFNVEKYSTIHFVSTSVKVTGKNSGDVTGDLTMLGITKPVVLHVHFNKAGYNSYTQNFVAGFSATATVKRSDFGMNYLIHDVGDEVRIEIHTEGIDIDKKNAERIKH